MTKVQDAEVEYHRKFGHYGTLADLGPTGARFISEQLSSGTVGTYKIVLHIEENHYWIRALPENAAIDPRSFYSDETRVIRMNHGPAPATASSQEFK